MDIAFAANGRSVAASRGYFFDGSAEIALGLSSTVGTR
jgi:hypothetical protein